MLGHCLPSTIMLQKAKHSIHLQEGSCQQSHEWQNMPLIIAGTAQELQAPQKCTAPGEASIAGCSAVWYRVTANECSPS